MSQTVSHVARRARRHAGFSLLELLIVIAVLAIALSVGVVSIQRSRRASTFETTLNSAVDLIRTRVASAATGMRQSVNIDEVTPGVDWISVNPRRMTGVTIPAEDTVASQFDLQGQTGYPLVNGERHGVAIVIVDSSGYNTPALIVVASNGVVTVTRPTGRSTPSW